MLILRNRVLTLGNVHICVVPPCYVVDLLNLKNRFFRFRKVKYGLVLFWKEVVLLIFTNSVFMLQNFQIFTLSKSNGVYLLIFINGILAAKSTDKSSTILQDLLMPSKSIFTVRNVEIWAVLSSNEVDLLMFRNS